MGRDGRQLNTAVRRLSLWRKKRPFFPLSFISRPPLLQSRPMLLRTRERTTILERSQFKVSQTRWAALGLLFTHYLLLLHGVTAVYFTADEPAYIAGGYALLARGTE
ncbi:MAG: hypothetical protein KDE56_34150, partial [Anaerolineales bacterium]|nr:hypothetical protein [Anaerolineales bacterium]